MTARALASVSAPLRRAWGWLRLVSGDSAYDAYAARARARSQPPPSREEFWLDSLRRRYSGISRCC